MNSYIKNLTMREWNNDFTNIFLILLQSDLSSKQTFLKLKTDLECGTLSADELKDLMKEDTHNAIVEENRKYTDTATAK